MSARSEDTLENKKRKKALNRKKKKRVARDIGKSPDNPPKGEGGNT